MANQVVINPVENIRLSSELWKEDAVKQLSLLQRSLTNICDHFLISQNNFIDRMKENAEIAAGNSAVSVYHASVSVKNNTINLTNDIMSVGLFVYAKTSNFIDFELSTIFRQIKSFSRDLSVTARRFLRASILLEKRLSLLSINNFSKFLIFVKTSSTARSTADEKNVKVSIVQSAIHHPVKAFTAVTFTGLTIYVAFVATHAIIQTNWSIPNYSPSNFLNK
ncbi:hypothetical protein [Oenococcus sicerae]|uniref:hypothetical protein n=1 Tax=Oenococcus sicerae TaxID=2203724 RepID=UPI001FAC5143|nr:hypothetical protein [Oenococcus sicerae]